VRYSTSYEFIIAMRDLYPRADCFGRWLARRRRRRWSQPSARLKKHETRGETRAHAAK
jgi:hypothetical protein